MGSLEARRPFRVVDAHVHLPLRHAGGDAVEAARLLLREMDEAGVDYAVVIAIEASPRVLRGHVTPERLRQAVTPVIHDPRAMAQPLARALVDPGSVIEEQARLFKEHLAPSEAVAEAARVGGGRLFAVASYCREEGVEGFIRRLEALRARGARLVGVKLYPTLHFLRPDDPVLEPLYDYMEGEGLALIVHTGCDPGIWELPAFCTTANPRHLEPIARKHKDLTIIAAHMGSYSYLFPGIYFAEALRAARSHPNIYLDTSATTLRQVKIALEKVGAGKLLYGSDYPYASNIPIKDILEAYLEAGLPERVKERILCLNASEILAQAGYRVECAP